MPMAIKTAIELKVKVKAKSGMAVLADRGVGGGEDSGR